MLALAIISLILSSLIFIAVFLHSMIEWSHFYPVQKNYSVAVLLSLATTITYIALSIPKL